MIISRRNTLILAAAATAASVAGLGAARADDQVVIDEAKLMAPAGLPDHVLGNKDAKVTMVEYGSPTCPHCGRFHADVYPQIKSKYIDTGKIKFIFRPFILSGFSGTDSAITILAEVAGDDNFYNVIDTYYDNQSKWTQTDKVKDAIVAIALQLGFTEDSFNQALSNQAWGPKLQASEDQAVNDFKVSGTPTFYINGKQLVGEQTIDDISKAIDPLLG